jgi:hypothetical protein
VVSLSLLRRGKRGNREDLAKYKCGEP